MTTPFEQAFAWVVGVEGGYSDDVADPGGATKFGISAAAYPALNIAALTLADAQAIYRRDYWNHLQGDNLPPALALLAFDAAVNNGLGRGTTWLQAAVGTIQDGQIGPATMAAVKAAVTHGLQAALVEFMAQRICFMGGLPTWRTFGLGWSRRLAGLPYAAQAMVSLSLS